MGVVCSSESPATQSQLIQRQLQAQQQVPSIMELYYVTVSPPCRAVLLTMRALELNPEYRELDMFGKAEQKEAWFLKINPTHTLPTLVDDEFKLWESRAILAYLVNKYGKSDALYPNDPQKRAEVDKMLYFDIGTLYKSICDYWHPQVFGGQAPDSQKANLLKQSLDYLDQFLLDKRFVAIDQLTIADFALVTSVTSLEGYCYDIGSYENVMSWIENIRNALPYYEECVQKGIDLSKTMIESIINSQ